MVKKIYIYENLCQVAEATDRKLNVEIHTQRIAQKLDTIFPLRVLHGITRSIEYQVGNGINKSIKENTNV